MLKKILVTAMISQTALCAKGLEGFSFGALAGTEGRAVQFNNKNASQNTEDTKYRVGQLFGLFGRYGHVLKNYYVGGEIYMFGANRNGSIKLGDQNSSTNTVTYKRGIVTGMAPIVGHMFGEDTVGYAKFGFEMSRDNVKYQTSTTQHNKSSTVLAFAPGFGIDHMFKEHVIGGVEYSYSIGQKIKTNNSAYELTAQRRSHQVMFKFAYKI